MELPIPEKSASQSRPSKILVTLAIAFWVLILSGVFAGLIVTVGSTNSEKKVAAGTRQNAYRELLPALELVDDITQSNRNEVLLEALDIIDKKVLKIDPRHPLAIQTKDEIQIELGLIKESTIGSQEKTISEQVRNLSQARKEIANKNKEISDLQQQVKDMQKQAASTANNNNNNNQGTKGTSTRRRS